VSGAAAPIILVDADACPVKEEVYKVAWRHEVPVRIVSNARLRVPQHPLIERVTVSGAFDAADDWIAAQVTPSAIVVTGDMMGPRAGRRVPRTRLRTSGGCSHLSVAPSLLADRCLKGGAGAVIAPDGRPFTAASIGAAVATRAILADLRAGADGIRSGPAPFARSDRSRFLSALDEALVRLKRGRNP